MEANRSAILAEMKHLLRERSDDEVSDVEAEKIAENAAEFFKILLRWEESSSENMGLDNGQ